MHGDDQLHGAAYANCSYTKARSVLNRKSRPSSTVVVEDILTASQIYLLFERGPPNATMPF